MARPRPVGRGRVVLPGWAVHWLRPRDFGHIVSVEPARSAECLSWCRGQDVR